MQVRYNPVVGWVFLALGLVNLVLGVWPLLLGEFQFSLILGLLICVLGPLYLTRPYFQVDEDSIRVLALLGPGKREFRLSPSESIVTDGGRLLIADKDGSSRKVPVRKWISRTVDWDAVVSSAAGRG